MKSCGICVSDSSLYSCEACGDPRTLYSTCLGRKLSAASPRSKDNHAPESNQNLLPVREEFGSSRDICYPAEPYYVPCSGYNFDRSSSSGSGNRYVRGWLERPATRPREAVASASAESSYRSVSSSSTRIDSSTPTDLVWSGTCSLER